MRTPRRKSHPARAQSKDQVWLEPGARDGRGSSAPSPIMLGGGRSGGRAEVKGGARAR